MLATLKAVADQVNQPSWGLGGPHDAGSYCIWPHQTGFFHQHGSWSSAYGKFFMQWYSEMLIVHSDSVLSAAREVFDGTPLALAVRIPGSHWWFNTSSHAPEMAAG
jgi:beta-amylase